MGVKPSGVLRAIARQLPEGWRLPLKLAYFHGHRIVCPLCGYSAREWAIIGHDLPVLRELRVTGAGRRSGGCHRCGAMERERLIYLYLRDRLHYFEEDGPLRVLHVAPERSLSARLLERRHTEYVRANKFAPGQRPPDGMLDIDILDIPFDRDYFDLVICNHVLEHIVDDGRAIRELHRVLKTKGRAILQVPLSLSISATIEDSAVTTPEFREQRFGQSDHVRIYGPDYVDRLCAAGFLVERLKLADDPAYARYGLQSEEDLFVGRK